MKKSFILILLCVLGISAYSQNAAPTESSSVKWLTIQEAEKLNKQTPRPIFIDTYTDCVAGVTKWTGKHLPMQLSQIFSTINITR